MEVKKLIVFKEININFCELIIMDVKAIKSQLDAVIQHYEENMNKMSRNDLNVLTEDFLKKLDTIMYMVGQELGISSTDKEVYVDLENVSDEIYEIIEKCVEWGPYCTEEGLYFPPNKP